MLLITDCRYIRLTVFRPQSLPVALAKKGTMEIGVGKILIFLVFNALLPAFDVGTDFHTSVILWVAGHHR